MRPDEDRDYYGPFGPALYKTMYMQRPDTFGYEAVKVPTPSSIRAQAVEAPAKPPSPKKKEKENMQILLLEDI